MQFEKSWARNSNLKKNRKLPPKMRKAGNGHSHTNHKKKPDNLQNQNTFRIQENAEIVGQPSSLEIGRNARPLRRQESNEELTSSGQSPGRRNAGDYINW